VLEKVKVEVREIPVPTDVPTWNLSSPAWIASVASPSRFGFREFFMAGQLDASGGGIARAKLVYSGLAYVPLSLTFDPETVIEFVWLVFISYWFAASFRVEKMVKREPLTERVAGIFLLVIVFLLFYSDDLRFGVLIHRFIPDQDWILWLGAVFTVAGVAFAIWARFHIGRYWSGTVALREGHELIRTGPYARIRHPIYTGLLFALFGTALAIGRYRAFAAFLIVLCSLIWKSKREEKLLSGQFGEAFEEHRRRTGFFLPRLLRPS
jgi:protein-S-isoprenylcysteine O-methyltransferase Ste14